MARSPHRLVVGGGHLGNDKRLSDNPDTYVYERGDALTPDFSVFEINGYTPCATQDDDPVSVYEIEAGDRVTVTWTGPWDYDDPSFSFPEQLQTPALITLLND